MSLEQDIVVETPSADAGPSTNDERASLEHGQPSTAGDQLAASADDPPPSSSSSAWTSTASSGDPDINAIAPGLGHSSELEQSDGHTADDELESTDEGSLSSSAEVDADAEELAQFFGQTSLDGHVDGGIRRFLAMLSRELSRDIKEPEVKPAPSAYRPAAVEIAEFSDNRAVHLAQLQEGQRRVRILQMHPFKHHSNRTLGELERIEIKSLVLRKNHMGHYLLVRTIALPVLVAGLLLVCQDPSGTACRVELHGQPFNLNSSPNELDALIPKGSVLAIKAPRLRDDLGGNLSVQVFSPTDVVWISAEDVAVDWHDSALASTELPPKRTAKTWKKVGNEYLRKEWHFAAERAFTLGLQVGENASLRLARSQVRSLLGLKRAASKDAEAVLELDRSSYSAELLLSALLRSVASAIDLQLWAHAKERLEEARALSPAPSEQIDHYYEVIATAQHAAATGEYDLPALLEASLVSFDLNIADYVHPVLCVEPVEGGGRRVITTTDLKAGQLLAFVKPIAACYDFECAHMHALNLESMTLEGPTRIGLVHKLNARIIDDPAVAKTLDHLYAGDQFACLSAGYPLADLAASGCSTDGLTGRAVDSARVEAIQSMHAVHISPLRPDIESYATPNVHGRALFAPLAAIRHSLTPNAFLYFLGEAMVLRADSDLAVGTEVCTAERASLDALVLAGPQALGLPNVESAREPKVWEDLFDERSEAIEIYVQKESDPTDGGWVARPELCLPYESLLYIAFELASHSPDMSSRPDWAVNATGCGLNALDSIGALANNPAEVGDDEIQVRAPIAAAEVALRICLLVAGTWKAVDDEPIKMKWLRAASRLEAITFGGGREMLQRLCGDHIHLAGLFADELV